MHASVGTPVAWAARYLKMNGRRRLLGSFNHESMANALLQAIGAQAAFPKRRVVSMSGDGGFAMMMGAFPTLVQASLPVKQRHARLRGTRNENEGVGLSRRRLRPEEP